MERSGTIRALAECVPTLVGNHFTDPLADLILLRLVKLNLLGGVQSCTFIVHLLAKPSPSQDVGPCRSLFHPLKLEGKGISIVTMTVSYSSRVEVDGVD